MLAEIKGSITAAKLLAILAVCGLCFWFGHHVAANAGAAKLSAAEAAFSEYRRKEADETATAYQAAQVDAQANAVSLAQTLSDTQDARDKIDAAYKGISHDAQTLPHVHCGLDANGVQLWNRANAAIGH